MSTRSYIKIQATIEGELNFDYADDVRSPDVVKKELELICAKYGLVLSWEEIY